MRQEYVGYCRGGHEFEVAESLTWDGFDVWVGRVKVRRRGAKGSRVQEEPALPNYLWMALDENEFHHVEHKHLHKTFLPLTRLGVSEFARFKSRIEHLGIIDSLNPGAIIEITDGPFKDSMATLSALVEGGEKLLAEFELFGRTTLAELPVGHVRAAG